MKKIKDTTCFIRPIAFTQRSRNAPRENCDLSFINIKNTKSLRKVCLWGRDVSAVKNVSLFPKKTRVGFSASKLGGLQPPVTPVRGYSALFCPPGHYMSAVHMCMGTHTYTDTQRHTHTTHTYTDTHAHNTHTDTYTYKHRDTCAHTDTRTQDIQTHTHKESDVHTHTQTHTHTHLKRFIEHNIFSCAFYYCFLRCCTLIYLFILITEHNYLIIFLNNLNRKFL